MKYFLHDSNAFNDEKISELFINFGYEGLGLFYTILEKLASQEKPIKTIVLKSQLKVGKKLDKCWNFMETIGLISSNNGETFNEQLLKFSEKYKIKSEKNAKRILEWRNNQSLVKNVTHSESVRNTPKVKRSKEKLSKVNESNNINTEFSNENLHSQDLSNNQSLEVKKENTLSLGGGAKIDIDKRKLEFRDKLIPFLETYGKESVTNFYNYWTETSKNGLKFRMESEKFFDIKRRLTTWVKNDKFSTSESKDNSLISKNRATAERLNNYYKHENNSQDAIQ